MQASARTKVATQEIQALILGNLHELEKLHPSFFSTADSNGWLPAHFAARSGRADVIEHIHKQCDAEALTVVTRKHGLTIAHLAARGGHINVLHFLIDHFGRSMLEVVDADGWTPAHSAARGGHLDVLQLIFESLGAGDVLNERSPGPTVEQIAAQYSQIHILRFLQREAEQIDYELSITLDQDEDRSTRVSSSSTGWSDAQDEQEKEIRQM